MKVASDDFRETPHYRRDCFREGLGRLGFRTGVDPLITPTPRDVLLLWNRGPAREVLAERYEKAGAKVLIAENGYCGRDVAGRQLYALALWQHAGAGEWFVGDEDRWSKLNMQCQPWRSSGKEIVLLPQRGIGNPKYAMPKDWVKNVTARLKLVTDRPIVVREHPGKDRTDPMPALKNAWAAVTWASGAGIKAIVGGVPVFHDAPHWIGAPAAKFGIEDIENPFLGDRMPMLHRLSYAQWTLQEIQMGEAFRWLLR
jgi:hypothetical protein